MLIAHAHLTLEKFKTGKCLTMLNELTFVAVRVVLQYHYTTSNTRQFYLEKKTFFCHLVGCQKSAKSLAHCKKSLRAFTQCKKHTKAHFLMIKQNSMF